MKRTKSNRQPTITLSHLDKLLFPESNITKQDVIRYYTKIAPFLVPHVKDHLIVMHRFPNGIGHIGFYQKQIPDYFPSWISRKKIKLKTGEQQTLVMIATQADLIYLANQGVLVFHSWLSSVTHINYPDKIVFDIDPSGNPVQELRFLARQLKKILEEYGLVPFIMTTGSRGYHIVTPILPEHSFKVVHDFAKSIAQQLVNKYPDYCTIEINKAKRKQKIFIDYLRNSYGQTSVACYSLRAHEGAPIATPISWPELSRITPQQYTIKNIFKRVARKQDPWKDFVKKAKRLLL